MKEGNSLDQKLLEQRFRRAMTEFLDRQVELLYLRNDRLLKIRGKLLAIPDKGMPNVILETERGEQKFINGRFVVEISLL